MRNYLLIATFILLVFQSCYKEPDFTNFDYETYNRVVGPLGGEINFYANYGDDSENSVLVNLNIPESALDSVMVFNMYQYEDYELVLQMKDGYSEIGSKFLYFVPFYESEGYHERGQLDLSYHLSVDFNEPVTVSYNFLADGSGISDGSWQESQLYYDHYKKTNRSYQLYRIKIPKLDEWGEADNIYVNWNNQGYPDGYDQTDLYYIISGIWSPLNDWGTGYFSLENWEPVQDFNLNSDENSISFDIYNTDYIYVICRIIYIKAENVPIKITNSVEKLYPTLEIERASFNGENYTIFLSDNSYAHYTKNGEFLYLIDGNLSKSELPWAAQTYINTNYPDDLVKKVTRVQSEDWNPHEYEVLLRSGIKLFFGAWGELSGSFQYGFEPSDLPADALSYLLEAFPGEIINNVTFDNENLLDPIYIVYLSSDAKVYFDGTGSLIEILYYRVDENELPENIAEYFNTNYPNTAFSVINYSLSEDGSYYDISLADGKWFRFDDDGTLWELEFNDVDESELPTVINSFIETHFPNKEITEIYFYSYDYGNDEVYDIYFSDQLNIEFDPGGTVTALYGNNLLHLPLPLRNYIQSNYPDENLLFCSFNSDAYVSFLGPDEEVIHEWELFFEGNMWLGINEGLEFVYLFKYEAFISSLEPVIRNYFSINYPGETTVYELANYYSEYYGETIYFVGLYYDTFFVFDEAGNLLDQYVTTKKKTRISGVKKSIPEKKMRSKRAEVINKLQEK